MFMVVTSVSEVSDRLSRELTAGQMTAASVMIENFQGELETWLGRSLGSEAVTDERHEIEGGSGPDVHLSLARTPVSSVSSVTVDGVVWSASLWRRSRSGVWVTSAAGWSTFTADPAVVLVTYVGGYDKPMYLAAAKSIVEARVIRALNRTVNDDAEGAESIAVEGYAVKYVDDGFLPQELLMVRRAKRRGVW